MVKSKTFDKEDMKDDEIPKSRLPKKRESLLLPPTNASGLKSRFFDRNKIKRNSWNAGLNGKNNNNDDDVTERLANILQAAAQKNMQNEQRDKASLVFFFFCDFVYKIKIVFGLYTKK